MAANVLKPFSQACVNNAEPILEYLQSLLEESKTVLEIGSGTGQHAVYFGSALSHLTWQTSDVPENIPGIIQWLLDSGKHNVLPPFTLDVTKPRTIDQSYDAVFMANTLHIMPWPVVEMAIKLSAKALNEAGLLIIYGPFNYDGNYTSDSNARFDQWLKASDAERGIRDIEKVNALTQAEGFVTAQDYSMPANNRLLVWCLKGKRSQAIV